MAKGKVILENERMVITINRLCHQLIEDYYPFDNTCIIGIQPRGVDLSNRIVERLDELGIQNFSYGKLDITFYRDDFRRRDKPLKAQHTEIDFLVEGKDVLLIDDVLYTGRTIQAAITAVQTYGRANNIKLLTLIDRRFHRHLPIIANYTGLTIDALDEAYVVVEWFGKEGRDRVLLYPEKGKY